MFYVLSTPLIPSASFAVWVRLWVKHSICRTPHQIDPPEFQYLFQGNFRAVLIKGHSLRVSPNYLWWSGFQMKKLFCYSNFTML